MGGLYFALDQSECPDHQLSSVGEGIPSLRLEVEAGTGSGGVRQPYAYLGGRVCARGRMWCVCGVCVSCVCVLVVCVLSVCMC